MENLFINYFLKFHCFVSDEQQVSEDSSCFQNQKIPNSPQKNEFSSNKLPIKTDLASELQKHLALRNFSRDISLDNQPKITANSLQKDNSASTPITSTDEDEFEPDPVYSNDREGSCPTMRTNYESHFITPNVKCDVMHNTTKQNDIGNETENTEEEHNSEKEVYALPICKYHIFKSQ